MKTQIFFHSYDEIGKILKDNNIQKYMVVGSATFERLPVKQYLDGLGVSYVPFSDFESNPTYESIVKGVKLYHDELCQMVISIGGGSAIDVGKCIKLFAPLPDGIDYLSTKYLDRDIKFLAYPTTAGTGSESTHFAVVYYQGNKNSIAHESMLADYVVLDGKALTGLPLYQKKSTLLDALCQAIESWWSVNSTEASKALSAEAIHLIIGNWEKYLASDESTLEPMLKAANLAGQAINITKTTAAHAMSYKLTSLYGLAHGHAVAICLPKIWRYMNMHMEKCIDRRSSDYLKGIFTDIAKAMGCMSVCEAINKFEIVLKAMEMSTPKVDEKGIEKLVDSVNVDRLKNTPVELDKFSIKGVYDDVLKINMTISKEDAIMNIYQELLESKTKLSLVGLGYVGMPIAVAFAKYVSVVGFDLNAHKIDLYKQGIDPTQEVGDEVIAATKVEFTADENKLREAKFHIIAVPTPVNDDHTPDLSPVEGASAILGRNLTKGSVVVYESTVYPGVTEDICVPILEKESGLKCGVDFKVAYSPERINPGDKEHRLNNIVKIVSGMDAETLDTVAKVYELVVEAGVYRAESIKVAEAAKVIENSQRDINIAFMNELSIIFNKMGIDTKSVLAAAGTKWNFLKFAPGLVGGHCIGVDPYYLTYKAEEMGYHSQVILAGRRINDEMGKYVAENLVKSLIKSDLPVRNAKIGILGITFKENCPDARNSKVADIVKELHEYGIEPLVYDPVANKEDAKRLYNVDLLDLEALNNLDGLIIAVAHKEFADLNPEFLAKLYKPGKRKILLDIKGTKNKQEYLDANYLYWRL